MAVSAKDYRKAYYILNREKRIQYQKEYNKKNIESYKDYQHAYFLIHQEDLNNKQKVQRQIERIMYPPIPKKKKVKKVIEISGVVEIPEKIPTPKIPKQKLPEIDPDEPEPFADFYRTSQGFALNW